MRWSAALLAVAGSLSAGSLSAGCHSPPEKTVDAYLDAVARGRVDDAYALLSTEYKRSHDRAAFARAVSPADQKAAQRRTRGGRVVYEAEVTLDDGARVSLVFEDGAWRLARDPLDVYPQGQPAEALRAFIRAVDNRRWDVVLRFVPSRYRASITVDKIRAQWETPGERATMAAQLAEIRRHLDDPFELTAGGDEARLPLGDRRAVRLVREDGVWKVEALE
jgi:hypothetical protein